MIKRFFSTVVAMLTTALVAVAVLTGSAFADYAKPAGGYGLNPNWACETVQFGKIHRPGGHCDNLVEKRNPGANRCASKTIGGITYKAYRNYGSCNDQASIAAGPVTP